MRLGKIIAGMGAAVALTLGLGGIANATVYTLNGMGGTAIPYPGSDTNMGTVTTTVNGANLNVTVQLAPLVYLNYSGNGFETIAFSTNTAVTGVTGLPADFTFLPASGGPYHEDGVGTYTYAVNYIGNLTNGVLPGGGIQTLSFVIDGATALAGVAGTGTTNYMSVDIATTAAGGTGAVNTGVVGATLGTVPVPEPATWALMILGVGMVGMAMRRRTAAATFA